MVVLKMCSSLPEKHNFKIFADNYFSNFAMVKELQQRGTYIMWVLSRPTGFMEPPLKSEKDLKKKGRGAVDSVVETTTNISLVRWLDNRCVTVVSSYLAVQPLDSVRRYDRSKKEHIDVERPSVIGVYNKVDGWDRLDGHDVLSIQIPTKEQEVVHLHILPHTDYSASERMVFV